MNHGVLRDSENVRDYRMCALALVRGAAGAVHPLPIVMPLPLPLGSFGRNVLERECLSMVMMRGTDGRNVSYSYCTVYPR